MPWNWVGFSLDSSLCLTFGSAIGNIDSQVVSMGWQISLSSSVQAEVWSRVKLIRQARSRSKGCFVLHRPPPSSTVVVVVVIYRLYGLSDKQSNEEYHSRASESCEQSSLTKSCYLSMRMRMRCRRRLVEASNKWSQRSMRDERNGKSNGRFASSWSNFSLPCSDQLASRLHLFRRPDWRAE